MKFVGVREFYNITRAKIVSALNCAIVMAVCATATFAVDMTLDYTSVEAQPIETTMQTIEVTITVVSYPEGFDPEHPEDYDPTQNAVASSESSTDMTSESTSETSESSSETSEETSESSETSETTAKPTATNTPVPTDIPTPTEKITETELYLAVYATTTINVRKGPGTEYDVVKSVYYGDQIDVIAVTSNGWY